MKRQQPTRRRTTSKRLLAGVVALISSGILLPYAWQGAQKVGQFFAGLRDDIYTLKVDQAQLKGQVTQIQSDLQIVLHHELQRIAQGGPLPNQQTLRKEGTP